MILRKVPHITCDQQVTEPMRFACDELRDYLMRILGGHDSESPPIRLTLREDIGLSDEGYEWRNDDQGLRITGGGDAGLVFVVYAFLREVCGCSFAGLGPDGEDVPQCDEIVVPMTTVRREPKLWYRGLQLSVYEMPQMYHWQIDWMAKNGLNICMIMLAPENAGPADDDLDPHTGLPANDGALFRITEPWFDRHLAPEMRKRGLKLDVNHHNLRFWLPPAKYFDDHPDWYSLTDGERGNHFSQLCICTSNDQAVLQLIENVRGFLRRRPEVKLIGIIPEDGHGMCQCDACVADDVNSDDIHRIGGATRSADAENRSIANRYAKLLNRVVGALSGEFPDVQFGGAAYVDLQWPPRDVTLASNTFVWLALYWRDGARPLAPEATSSINLFFYDLLRQWKTTQPSRLIAYAYYMGMNAQRSLPYPMSKVICEDWAHLKKLGVEGATVQITPACHDAYGMNLLAFARCGWEDEVDHASLLDDYLRGMFGSAADTMRTWYQGLIDALDELAADESQILQPDSRNIAYFMDKVDPRGALDAARRAASGERERRQLERFAVYVQYLELAAAGDALAVIDYVAQVDAPGWINRNVRSRWVRAHKAAQQQA